MNKPLVSVCVQTYQHVNYIKQCLDGILMQQTTFPFEIILGEDESEDGTREICIDYANKYPDKIKLFLRSRKDVIYINGNATGRYNFIENLKASKGKYIALCEGDDYWTDPLKLQKQVGFLEANDDYGICFHEAAIEWSQNNSFNSNIKLNSQFAWNKMDTSKSIYTIFDVFNGPFMATASVVFRNDIKEFPSWFYKAASGDITLYSLIIGKKTIKFINEVMCVYRRHPGGITRFHRGNSIILNRIETLKYINSHYKSIYINKIKQSVNDYLEGISKLNFKEFIVLLKLYLTSKLIKSEYLIFFFKKGLNDKLKR
ncbi:glycosyltransferase [Thalassobellus sediminis]|uniref:glycosyltransferase n=1 Tax=Thalassobellus sediminis TaxID=3367753 RepID=UPI00378E79F7